MRRRALRVLAAAAAGLTCLLVTGPPALAVDPRIALGTPDPFLLSGYCTDPAFDVLVTYTDANQYIVRRTVAADGTETWHITGKAKVTLTNTTSGESVSYNISGPGTIVFYPDGSFSVDAAGPNLLWTLPENLENFDEVPTIAYSTGRVTFTVDRSGQTTSYSLAGGSRQTDVCEVLAP
jgi:hypothetical protein